VENRAVSSPAARPPEKVALIVKTVSRKSPVSAIIDRYDRAWFATAEHTLKRIIPAIFRFIESIIP
jgi:hypothetical protein